MTSKLLRVASAVTTCLLAGLAACSTEGQQPSAGPDEPGVSPTASPAPTLAPTSAPAERLSGHLLFSRWDKSTGTYASHHVSLADGSEQTTIKMPGSQGGGRWSHSTGQIAVSIELPNARVSTAIIDQHGAVVRVLALPDQSLNMVCTVWSPDDERLACETWDDAHPKRAGLYTVRAADGGQVERLTSSTAGNQDQVGDYSPDGKDIVFKRTVDGSNGPLMVVPVDGGKPRQVAGQVVDDSGRYSPDGKTLAASAGGAILFFDVSSGKIVDRFAEEDHLLFGPSWSPDGTHVAYLNTVTVDQLGDIYIARTGGSEPLNITNTPESETVVDWGR